MAVATAERTQVAIIGTGERLKTSGVAPYWCMDHGPTTSLYSRDPDPLVGKFRAGTAVSELLQQGSA